MNWTCDTCGRDIEQGARYFKIVDVTDAEFPTFRTHTTFHCDRPILADILATGHTSLVVEIQRQVWNPEAVDAAFPIFS